jgi:hypothetical protein
MSNSNCCAGHTISLNVEKIVSGPQIKKNLMFLFVLKHCFSYNSVSIERFEYFDHFKPKIFIFGNSGHFLCNLKYFKIRKDHRGLQKTSSLTCLM